MIEEMRERVRVSEILFFEWVNTSIIWLRIDGESDERDERYDESRNRPNEEHSM